MRRHPRRSGQCVSLAERAYRIRRNALRMGEVQGQGYIGQALDIADVLAVAYFHAMRYRPDDPHWEGRDRFLLSIGHYAIALYAALIEAGILPEDELETYGADDSRLPMSGMAAYTPGMEMSGGSLGLGLSIAVGMALGLKRKGSAAASTTCSPTANSTRARPGRRSMSAAHYKLDNLVAIVDVNNQQADGPSTSDAGLRAAARQVAAFGWFVQRVDGNDIDAVVAAFDAARAHRAAAPHRSSATPRWARACPSSRPREDPLHPRRAARMAARARQPRRREARMKRAPKPRPHARRPKPRLTTSAMIASIAAEGQATRPPRSATRSSSWPRTGRRSSA